MSSGGVRLNAGRKKVGVVVNTRIDEEIISQLDSFISGNSRADRIRKCLLLGLKKNEEIKKENSYNSNSNTINRFFKTYRSVLSYISEDESLAVKIANDILLGMFTSNTPTSGDLGLNNEIYQKILNDLNKYDWSISERINDPNCITPNIVGSVIEKIVNQKDTGSYYTPKDTTNYISKFSIVLSIVSSCNSVELNHEFYSNYCDATDVNVFNSAIDPVETLANAINNLSDNAKFQVFKVIKNLKILDPTCGTGAFVISAADIMVSIYKQTNMYLYMSLNDFAINLFSNCLYGVDIEDYAISLIYLRAKLYLYNLGISKDIVDSITYQFYCGDALFDSKDFSWNDRFYNVINAGGFDCLIGNPPYVETSKSQYSINDFANYKTMCCGNLYAYVLEKSLTLLKSNCYMGMIVPISITSTPRMESLRKEIFDKSSMVFLSNFSDRPSCLFAGVHQKLTIAFVKKEIISTPCRIYTTSYIHWNKLERNSLFENIRYHRTTKDFISENEIAKIGNDVKLSILKKIADLPFNYYDFISEEKNNNPLYLNQRITFWTKCFCEPEKSSEYKTHYVNSGCSNLALSAILNSSLFYMLWETYSDCWHITKKDLSKIRFDSRFLEKKVQRKLEQLEKNLETALKENREYIYSKQTEYIYIHRKCYKEILAIDNYVSELYGLTDEEKQYVNEYNLKYRLSQETNSEGI